MGTWILKIELYCFLVNTILLWLDICWNVVEQTYIILNNCVWCSDKFHGIQNCIYLWSYVIWCEI